MKNSETDRGPSTDPRPRCTPQFLQPSAAICGLFTSTLVYRSTPPLGRPVTPTVPRGDQTLTACRRATGHAALSRDTVSSHVTFPDLHDTCLLVVCIECVAGCKSSISYSAIYTFILVVSAFHHLSEKW